VRAQLVHRHPEAQAGLRRPDRRERLRGCARRGRLSPAADAARGGEADRCGGVDPAQGLYLRHRLPADRKSTRLNSSHVKISYAGRHHRPVPARRSSDLYEHNWYIDTQRHKPGYVDPIGASDFEVVPGVVGYHPLLTLLEAVKLTGAEASIPRKAYIFATGYQ